MANSATVIAVGGATIPLAGYWTGQGMSGFERLLATALATAPQDIIRYDPTMGTVPSVASTDTGRDILVVADGVDAGFLAIPAGYGSIIFGTGSSGTVTGGDVNTTVVSAGNINYSGQAAVVVANTTVLGATGTYSDDATGATFDLRGGSYLMIASGSRQSINVDNGGQTDIIASGASDEIQLGDPSGAFGITSGSVGRSASAGVAAVSNTVTLTGRGDLVTVNSFDNLIDDSGGATTIAGVTGSSTIFAAANDVYLGSGAVTEFISSAGSQTVFGGSGNDSVFNTVGGSIVDVEGIGTAHIFVGGSGDSTIYGAGAGAVFAGSGQTVLVLGDGNDVFVGGQGGSSTIVGGSATPTIVGGNGDNINVVGSRFALEIAEGNGTTMNGALSSGGNNFFVPESAGNTTLIGSLGQTGAPAADNFVLLADSATGTGPGARTITVENWHAGDGLFLNNFSASDVQSLDSAINGGGSMFRLSDGTTVQFQGDHPTTAIGGVAF